MEYLDPIDSFENVKINYREVTGKTSSLSQNLDVRIKKKNMWLPAKLKTFSLVFIIRYFCVL